jgi:hypothetical protein
MKKSLKKQAVFPVLMLLVVTALALVGSSFAWFSVANQASVATITGQAENGGVGLMISGNYAGDFTDKVTMGTTADHFILPKYLKQVSSDDAVNFFAANIKSKNSDGSAKTISSKAFSNYYNGVAEGQTANINAADGTSGYIDFTVFLQVEQAAFLFFDFGTSVELANNGDGTAQAGAYRIAVGTPVAATSAAARSTVFKIYGDEVEVATGNGAWFPLTGASYVDEENQNPFNAYAQNDDYAAAGLAASKFNSMVPASGMTDEQLTSEVATAKANYIGTLAQGVNAVTFRVWLEGNDPQCTVDVALDTIALTLHFFACKQA